MELADFDAVIHQAGQRVLRFLKFHGKMAGIVIHAQMFGEPFVARMFGAKMIKEMQRLRGAFQQAKRFGFQAQMELASGPGADASDVLDAVPDVLPDGLLRRG